MNDIDEIISMEELVKSVLEHATRSFGGITEKLKASPHGEQVSTDRERIAALRKHWNAPPRHLFLRRALESGPWTDLHDRAKFRLGTGATLAFIGNRGTGKTQMAVWLMCHQTDNRLKSARYTKALEIFCSIRATYNGEKSELKAIEEWTRPELLVIDEAQVRGETDFENRILTHILDKRYDSLKDTIIISNLKREDFLTSLGRSITSRMTETGGIFEFAWESFR